MLFNLQTILEFFVVMVVLIVLHELGHFLACKLFHIKVDEFGLFFPPRARTLFKWGETDFTLNWLPLGGFVRPAGENDPTIEGGLAAANPWKRILVFSAGPLMNLLVAVILYIVIFAQIGTVPQFNKVEIEGVSPGSPAELAGLQQGDMVLKVDSINVNDINQMRTIVNAHLEQPIQLVYQRGQTNQEVTLTPRRSPPVNQGALGVTLGTPNKPFSWLTALPDGVTTTYYHVKTLFSMLGQLFTGGAQGRLMGIVGMAETYSEVRKDTPATQVPVLVVIFSFVIDITISLGILNFLPIPALDGGRILFALPEIILRRRIPPEAEAWVNGISLLLLIGLLILVNVTDVVNLVQTTIQITPTP